jgi:hypothetical protein
MELLYEQLYGFDAVGFIHLPGILDRAALAQCHAASDIAAAAAQLTEQQPVLRACLGLGRIVLALYCRSFTSHQIY